MDELAKKRHLFWTRGDIVLDAVLVVVLPQHHHHQQQHGNTGGDDRVSVGQPRLHLRGAGPPRIRNFLDLVHARKLYEKQQSNYARWLNYMWPKKIFTGSTATADARSVCGI